MFSIDLKKHLIKWNETPESERDYCLGLSILVQASGNRSLIWSIRNPSEKKDFIDYHLTKYIRFAISDDERKEVAKMDVQVRKIVKDNISLSVEKDEAKNRGKRDDHDSLPPEIQALYVENLDILHKIRDLHLKLRNLTAAYRQGNMKTQCIDAERYPFLKEIISLDKKMHNNWKTYDQYVPGQHSDVQDPESEESEE